MFKKKCLEKSKQSSKDQTERQDIVFSENNFSFREMYLTVSLINMKKSHETILKLIIFHYISDKMSSCGQFGNYSGQTEEI